ncbi:MAG TPA: hypothetical protein VEP70_08340, partial [Burkholderiales bacterium]|nr:hypothetical protein [Burkholderiales bacterium]
MGLAETAVLEDSKAVRQVRTVITRQYENARSFREKLRDELDGRLGIFFHDPVPGIWNDAAGDIGGDEAQIIRHCRAEGFL